MNTSKTGLQLQPLALPVLLSLLGAACATSMPVELSNARTAYARASAGRAADLARSDLHKAKAALDAAEQSYSEEQSSQKTVDLAYIAQRTAEIAEAHAVTAVAEKSTSKANQEFGDQQGKIAKNAQGALVKTREQLSEAERGQAAETQPTDPAR